MKKLPIAGRFLLLSISLMGTMLGITPHSFVWAKEAENPTWNHRLVFAGYKPEEKGREEPKTVMEASENQSPREMKIQLPKTVGSWSCPYSPRIIDASTIFEYMDGAGELYVGYRFDYLEVYEYRSEQHDNILVELYWMKSSDDAFGLLSQDWKGDPVELGGTALPEIPEEIICNKRALYGAGLLRLWSDTLYARVMAYNEIPAAKDAVLALGKAIVAGRKNPSPPQFVQSLPMSLESGEKLQRDRVDYFRSYLVLNVVYYLSNRNILDIDLSTEAIFAPYEMIPVSKERTSIKLLLIRYADRERALAALKKFHDVYLPEHKIPADKTFTMDRENTYPIEEGWMGYSLTGSIAALAFECPDQKTTISVLKQLQSRLQKVEANDGN